MPRYTNEKLWETYKNLPKDLKEVILSVDTTNIIKSIGKKYNLLVDKMGELDDEVGLVMLGLTHTRDFISNLAVRLQVDRETAKKIAEDVNSEIFQKVRESLRKIHGITGEEQKTPEVKPETRASTPPAAPKEIPKPRPLVSQIPPRPETPKPEPQPLEIRPIAPPETRNMKPEAQKETKPQMPIPKTPPSPLEKMKVMPTSPQPRELKKPPPTGGPPPGLPFLEKEKEKTIKFDPYKEPL